MRTDPAMSGFRGFHWALLLSWKAEVGILILRCSLPPALARQLSNLQASKTFLHHLLLKIVAHATLCP